MGKSRSIPIESEAIVVFQKLPRRGEFVFIGKNGKRPNENIFLRPLKLALTKTKIQKRVDLHTFRHSYGSNKIRQSWGLKKVSMLLGHSDISVTSNIYTHLLDGDLRVRDEFHFDKQETSPDSKVDIENLTQNIMLKLLENLSSKASKNEVLEKAGIFKGINLALAPLLTESEETKNTDQKPAELTEKSPLHVAQVLRNPDDSNLNFFTHDPQKLKNLPEQEVLKGLVGGQCRVAEALVVASAPPPPRHLSR